MNPKTERRFDDTTHSKTFQNIIRTFDLGHKRVLDIGCSYGEFLIHFGTGSVGVTVTDVEVAYGKKKGLDIRLGNIEADSLDLPDSFDVIFANNIFEHLYSPHHFLIKIKKFLKPNGLLILGVPCVPKIESLLKLSKFRGSLAVEHINFFTHTTLQKTVERGGWIIDDVRGFHVKNRWMDYALDPIYPHLYIIARPEKDFKYPDRRLKELLGYKDLFEIEGL